MVCIVSFKVIDELQRKDCISHMLQRLAGIDECVDNFCKWKVEVLPCHCTHGVWFVTSTFHMEQVNCLVDINVVKILWKFQIPTGGNWACTNRVYQAFSRGGGGGGWNEPNGGGEYDIIFKSYAVTILTSIVNLVCQTPAVKGQD